MRAIAILAAYNEEDVIGQVVRHLGSQGVSVYLIDDGSTDATVAEAEAAGLIGLERRPRSSTYRWEEILRRKEELAQELDADWLLHHDADELRESPWPLGGLSDALGAVEALGYNAVDFAVLNFRPTDRSFSKERDLDRCFRHYETAASFDRLQVKAWKKQGKRVDLVSSGGHEVLFTGRRVFPIRFLMRHYPIRGQEHGARKVFAERQSRLLPEEVGRGWHVQYDGIGDEASFLRDPATLTVYDAAEVRLSLLLTHRDREEGEAAAAALERLAREHKGCLLTRYENDRLQEELDRVTREAEALHGALDARNREAARLHVDLDRANREVERLRGEGRR